MNVLVYNACLLAGLVACATGAGLQWGLPVGLMVGGVLMLALTVLDGVTGA